MIKDIIQKNRSYRRFQHGVPVGEDTLKSLVDLARLSASAANLQPLKYIISSAPEKNALIFPTLKWAGYLKDWDGPKEGERPTAYIIILGDTSIAKDFGYDPGIAAQSILIGAVEAELGGCIIGCMDQDSLRKNLKIADCYEILLVIALGKPKEKIVIEDVVEQKEIKYWRDETRVHHVPKRRLDDIIVG
ncbi:nitroreductase family protein [Candidatus Omnitrophota bacterium]